MVKVAIYVRLSDEDRNKQNSIEESESIQNQKSMLTDYCKERNWDIFDIYCDEDYSGIDSTRPDFNCMIKDCGKGKIDIVLCKSQSRFSRDMEVIEKYLHDKFIEWEVRFIGVVDHTDTSDIANKKSRQINGLVNEWYLEYSSENIRKTLQHKRENGEFTGSFAVYGYSVDPNNKNHLIIDEEAAPVVRKIFDWYIQGWGYRRIVLKLNKNGIPSPTLYKEQHNSRFYNTNVQKSSSKGLWTQPTIYRIIRNETYTGTLVQGKTHTVSYKNKKVKFLPEEQWLKVYNTHEAIISQEVWEQTKKRLNSRLRVSKITKELSVLSGKIKCAECGKAIKRNVYYNKAKTKKYYSLRCATYNIGAMNCINKSTFSGLKLEKIVLEQINSLIKEYCEFGKIHIQDNNEEQIKLLNSSIINCKNIITDKQNKIDKLYEDKYEDKLEGVITLEQYSYYKDKFSVEIKDATDKKNELEQDLENLEDNHKSDMVMDKIIHKYSHIDKLDRTIVDELIDMIYIGYAPQGEPRPIKIEWKV